jgi:hypothetical protein
MGSEDKVEQSLRRPCRLTNGRSKRTNDCRFGEMRKRSRNGGTIFATAKAKPEVEAVFSRTTVFEWQPFCGTTEIMIVPRCRRTPSWFMMRLTDCLLSQKLNGYISG